MIEENLQTHFNFGVLFVPVYTLFYITTKIFNKSLWGITARNLSKKKNDQKINLMIQILE